jgi:hypothetical protein
VRNVASAAIPTPTVAVATVVAKDDGKPPFLLLVDGAGTARLAAAKTWADLDANKLEIAKKATKLGVLDKYVREDYALGRDPLAGVTSWNELGDVDLDLSALDDSTKHAAADQDDPPPPPPEQDGDESGGTGTAMALGEGKMGKKDSDRAEGQYKMKKNEDDPQLARQQAIDQARAAGVLGASNLVGGGVAPAAFGLDRLNEDGTPSRVAQVQGTVMKDGKLEPLRAMITYCYEKALVASPSLRGTVQVQFFIKPDGTVASAAASGVDPDVATCVANVIRSLAFPKPAGGGGVLVNYPVTFHR